MRVCYTHGTFDLLHVGHVRLLEKAKALGDYLIVGVHSDDTAESYKRVPILDLESRMEMVRALKCVSEVVEQDSVSPVKNLFELKPQVIAKGEGAGWEDGHAPKDVEDWALTHDIEIHWLPRTDGVSTSDIIARIKAL